MDKLFEADAITALATHLRGPDSYGDPSGKDSVSLLFPLAIGNTLTAALNMAAELGELRVTAEIVRSC